MERDPDRTHNRLRGHARTLRAGLGGVRVFRKLDTMTLATAAAARLLWLAVLIAAALQFRPLLPELYAPAVAILDHHLATR